MLAIDTATGACSVALFDDGQCIDVAHADVGRGHAEHLLPMIAALDSGGRADAIAVDIGPGSFTGIRVGVAAARALGFGWGAQVSGYHSLALLAAIDGARADTTVAVEGGHGQLFIGRYGADLSEIDAPRSLSFAEAVGAIVTQRVIGNAADRVIAARGFGVSAAVKIHSRSVASLPAHALARAASPFYGRPADAQPMQAAS